MAANPSNTKKWTNIPHNNRGYSVVLTTIKTGHTRATHKYLPKKKKDLDAKHVTRI